MHLGGLSDLLQEAFVRAWQKLDSFLLKPDGPLFVDDGHALSIVCIDEAFAV